MTTQTQLKLTNARQKAMKKWVELMHLKTLDALPLSNKLTSEQLEFVNRKLKAVNDACDKIDHHTSKAI